MSNHRLWVFALMFVLPLGVSALGQATNTGTIVGTVADESGAVIPGTEVTVENVQTGLTRLAISNDSGRYRIPLLPTGLY